MKSFSPWEKRRGKRRATAELWWWIAVNGASAAVSPMPLPRTVKVSPTPEQLLGFTTQAEQLATQRYLLTAPIDKVKELMNGELLAKVKQRQVAYIRPKNPQPPTKGETISIAAKL